jgi:integrase
VGKTGASPKIDTPARRRRLPPDAKLVWSTIGDARSGLKLGYRPSEDRKRAKPGMWIAKSVFEGSRIEKTLGPADDDVPDDGGDRLSYADAVKAAIEWSSGVRAGAATGETPAATIKEAVEAYVAARTARSARNGNNAAVRLAKHVLGDEIAALAVKDVTAQALGEWRARLPQMAGLNRLLNDFRAALNSFVKAHWRDLPPSIGKEIAEGLKRVPGAQTARMALLSDADVRSVVDACCRVDSDLGALVVLLAATGARFSQVARVTVADLQIDAKRVMIPPSNKGKGEKQRRPIAFPLGEDTIAKLAPLAVGRRGSEPLLERWGHRQIAGTKWEKTDRRAWSAAYEMQDGWGEALKLAGVDYVEPYALRHSSIVRMLRAGLPVRVVAALHDTSIAMIEAHYSAFIVDMADELARMALAPIVSAAPAPLRVGAALHDTSSMMIERLYSAHTLDLADELARQATMARAPVGTPTPTLPARIAKRRIRRLLTNLYGDD